MRILVAIFLVLLLAATAYAATSRRAIRLNWDDNSNNESNFEIWRLTQQGGARWRLIAVVGANATTYLDRDVRDGRWYCYIVVATNKAGDSPDSNQSCVNL